MRRTQLPLCHERSKVHSLGLPPGEGPNESHYRPAQKRWHVSSLLYASEHSSGRPTGIENLERGILHQKWLQLRKQRTATVWKGAARVLDVSVSKSFE